MLLAMAGACLDIDQELTATLFDTYVYLVKADKPVGPRDLMRGANLSSPSVAYRNLQKLIDIGLVTKNDYGNYIVKEESLHKGICLGRKKPSAKLCHFRIYIYRCFGT